MEIILGRKTLWAERNENDGKEPTLHVLDGSLTWKTQDSHKKLLILARTFSKVNMPLPGNVCFSPKF